MGWVLDISTSASAEAAKSGAFGSGGTLMFIGIVIGLCTYSAQSQEKEENNKRYKAAINTPATQQVASKEKVEKCGGSSCRAVWYLIALVAFIIGLVMVVGGAGPGSSTAASTTSTPTPNPPNYGYLCASKQGCNACASDGRCRFCTSSNSCLPSVTACSTLHDGFSISSPSQCSCSDYTSRNTCTYQRQCGWCNSGSTPHCRLGTAVGPIVGPTCQNGAWSWIS